VAEVKPKRTAASALTEARILEGAALAFGELGYARVRVEDILVAAGLSRPTFYKVFASKEQVFEALSARHHREIRRRIRAAAESQTSAILRLDAVVDTFLRWRATLGPMGRVLDVEARTPGSAIAHHRKHTLKVMTEHAAGWLAEDGRGTVDPVVLLALVAAMESVADSLLLGSHVGDEALARAKHAALRILGGTLAGPHDAVPPLPLAPKR
jgi:AcrR family transcriptional regulator